LPTSAAAGKSLLDTGPLVALLSKRDAAHAAGVEAFEAFRGHLFTTEPVLTEAMHLLGRQPGGRDACLEFFLRAGALIVPLDGARMARCRELMARYADVPMDFADATLVALAEDLAIAQVFTLDRRGFSAYRWRRTRRFVLSPPV
jgi:predicted nucleic acid-binding protein